MWFSCVLVVYKSPYYNFYLKLLLSQSWYQGTFDCDKRESTVYPLFKLLLSQIISYSGLFGKWVLVWHKFIKCHNSSNFTFWQLLPFPMPVFKSKIDTSL